MNDAATAQTALSAAADVLDNARAAYHADKTQATGWCYGVALLSYQAARAAYDREIS